MNLDKFNPLIPYLFIILFNAWCIKGIFSGHKNPYIGEKSEKFLKIFHIIFFPILVCLYIFSVIAINYVNSGYSNIAKITLHTCTKDNKTIEHRADCEYIGAITYRPYLRELMITTTPLYPILNCPSPNNGCIQERIFVDKRNVKSITALE